jgi:hypothetical protein
MALSATEMALEHLPRFAIQWYLENRGRAISQPLARVEPTRRRQR